MGYRLDGPVFMVGPKPMRTEFGIHQRLEPCGQGKQAQIKSIDRALNNATRAPSSAFHSRNHPLFIVLRHTTHTSTGA